MEDFIPHRVYHDSLGIMDMDLRFRRELLGWNASGMA